MLDGRIELICPDQQTREIIRAHPRTKANIQTIKDTVADRALTLVLGPPQVGKTTTVKQAFPSAPIVQPYNPEFQTRLEQAMDEDSDVIILDEFNTIFAVADGEIVLKDMLKRKKVVSTTLPWMLEHYDRSLTHQFDEAVENAVTISYFPDDLTTEVLGQNPKIPRSTVEGLVELVGGQIHILKNTIYDDEFGPELTLRMERIVPQSLRSIGIMPKRWMQVVSDIQSFNVEDEEGPKDVYSAFDKYGLTVKEHTEDEELTYLRSDLLDMVVAPLDPDTLTERVCNYGAFGIGLSINEQSKVCNLMFMTRKERYGEQGINLYY